MLTLDPEHLAVRPALAADDAFLNELYAAGRDDLRASGMDPAMLAPIIDMQWRAQRAAYEQAWPAAQNLVAERDGLPVGRLLVDCTAAPWRIVDIALLPMARGQGCGTALLRALQRSAVRQGAALALSVRRDNPGARRLYAALGFSAAGGDALAEQMIWR